MPHDYVLVAEPSLALARIFAQILADAQLDAVTVHSGQKACSTLLKWGVPRLLITNLVLPSVDGFAVLEDLRKRAPVSEVPAVVVSSSPELRKAAAKLRRELGISEIVTPTMSVTALRAAVKRALAAATHDPSLSCIPDIDTLRPPPPIPIAHSQDPVRLARIEAMKLTEDEPPEPALQKLVAEAAELAQAPIAFVSLVLDQRQWLKAQVGLSGALLEARSMPIEQSFCRLVVDDDLAAPLIVSDATKHPLFADNELVRRGIIGSYAGAPLRAPDGLVLGTLAVMHDKPLGIDQDRVDQLTILARRVAGELALSVAREPIERAQGSSQASLAAVLDQLDIGVLLTDMQRKVILASRRLGELLGLSADELAKVTYQRIAQRLGALSDAPDDIARRMRISPEGPFVAYEEIVLTRPTRRVVRWTDRPVRLPEGTMQLATFADVSAEAALRAIDAEPVASVIA